MPFEMIYADDADDSCAAEDVAVTDAGNLSAIL